MTRQIDKSKGPGVYIPPPLLYVAVFVGAVFIQKRLPISDVLFGKTITKITGTVILMVALFLLIKSLRQFFLTKNTVILIKPRLHFRQLMQLREIYVLGLTCFIKLRFIRWWNVIFFRVTTNRSGIYYQREENVYQLNLQEYEAYKNKVRRWL